MVGLIYAFLKFIVQILSVSDFTCLIEWIKDMTQFTWDVDKNNKTVAENVWYYSHDYQLFEPFLVLRSFDQFVW